MGIPQLQVTSEFSWDRDIYAEHWYFLCCKPERDVEQTVVWSVKWDSLTSSCYTVIISKSIDQCNCLIPNRTKAEPMATQFTDAYLSLDSDKWNVKRWLLLMNTRYHGNAFYITLICTWINGWINNHHADYSIKAASSDRHGVSNYRRIDCLFNSSFRLPTKKYQRSALLSLCDENPLWSVVPHTKGE